MNCIWHPLGWQFTFDVEIVCCDPAVQKYVCGVEVTIPSTATVGPLTLVVMVIGIKFDGAGAK